MAIMLLDQIQSECLRLHQAWDSDLRPDKDDTLARLDELEYLGPVPRGRRRISSREHRRAEEPGRGRVATAVAIYPLGLRCPLDGASAGSHGRDKMTGR